MSEKKEIGNFISLCANVYTLSDEESNISHDIPYTDSYSGFIDIKVLTKNPLYIRNHYEEGDEFYLNKDGEKISKEFCHFDGKPYIPATSIKGMVRSVLEIFSYSKLANKIDEKYYDKFNRDIYKDHLSDKIDLSEGIFGTTELKGRVYFSHFVAIKYSVFNKPVNTILMTPEAKKDKIGWKRYVQKEQATPDTKKKNENVVTEFIPLINATFEGKMRFHNLRDYELGALLSALTFHDTSSDSYHLLGMGKSQGYGKVNLKFKYKNAKAFMQKFELKMQDSLKYKDGYWNKSRYMKEIFKRHSLLNYPKTLFSEEEQKKLVQEKKEKEKKIFDEIIKNTEVPSKKILRKAIDTYFKVRIKPYYDISHLDEFLDENFVNTPLDIQSSYTLIWKNNNSEFLIDLLKKRKIGNISDEEKAVLYYFLQD